MYNLRAKEKKFKRMCVGCNEFFEKDQLIKLTVVHSDRTKIQVDLKQNTPGRSFYLYPRQNCLESFLKNKKKFLRKVDPKALIHFDEVIASLKQAIHEIHCPSLKEKA